MVGLIARRLAAMPLLLLIVSFAVFSMVILIPGDPAVTLAGGENATVAQVAAVRAELGLDRPFLARYWSWLTDAVRLDFGHSLITGENVADGLRHRLPITLSVVFLAIVVGLVVGVPAGIIAGTRPGSLFDRLGMFITSTGLAVPNFWLAMLLIAVFSINLQLFPSVGFTRFGDSPVDWLRSSILPAMALAVFVAASVARQLRSGVIGVMGSNYVRTGWAKGGRPVTVVGKHALKNASMATVTILGMQFTGLLSGSVVIEQIFSIPGNGSYLVSAVLDGDLPVVQGNVMFFVLINVMLTLALDITYGLLNPKVRVS